MGLKMVSKVEPNATGSATKEIVENWLVFASKTSTVFWQHSAVDR